MSPSAALSTPRRGRPARRALSLELQSALRFALAVAVSIGAVLLAASAAAAVVLLPLAGAAGALGLQVIAADQRDAVRPAEHARWDTALAAAFAVTALVLLAAGAPSAALLGGAAALALALLRLRTRYVV